MSVINDNKNRKIDRKKIDDITEVCKLVFPLFIGCSLLRFQSRVHLGAKTNEKKQRFIVVTRIKSEDEMKKKELEKQSTELVTNTVMVPYCNERRLAFDD